jgi:hypothetical protein
MPGLISGTVARLSSLGLGQRFEVELIRCHAVKTRVWPARVVEREVLADAAHQGEIGV